MDVLESITIRGVANGWVVQSGKAATDVLHVAVTPEALGEYVVTWAAQKQARGGGK